jgi:hypothetical protein
VSSASLQTGWRSLASWRHPATDSTARARPASPPLRLRAPPRARSRRRTAHRRSPLQGQRHSMSTSHKSTHHMPQAASTCVLVRAHTRREPGCSGTDRVRYRHTVGWGLSCGMVYACAARTEPADRERSGPSQHGALRDAAAASLRSHPSSSPDRHTHPKTAHAKSQPSARGASQVS